MFSLSLKNLFLCLDFYWVLTNPRRKHSPIDRVRWVVPQRYVASYDVWLICVSVHRTEAPGAGYFTWPLGFQQSHSCTFQSHKLISKRHSSLLSWRGANVALHAFSSSFFLFSSSGTCASWDLNDDASALIFPPLKLCMLCMNFWS